MSSISKIKEGFAFTAGSRFVIYSKKFTPDHTWAKYYTTMNPHVKDTKEYKEYEDEWEDGRKHQEDLHSKEK